MEVVAQSEVDKLLRTYVSSIELPYYYECKQLLNCSEPQIISVTQNGSFLKIVYSARGDRNYNKSGNSFYTNRFTVEIDLSKSSLWKDKYLSVGFSSESGIDMIEYNEKKGTNTPFIVNYWYFKCNSAALQNRFYEAFNSLVSIYKPQPKNQATNKKTASPQSINKSTTSNKSTKKTSINSTTKKVGKYVQ